MRCASRKYADLRRRLAELRKHLLFFLPSPPQSKTTYSAQECDLTRCYILLAHAEIENFCEDLALERPEGRSSCFTLPVAFRRCCEKSWPYYVAKEKRSWSEVNIPSTVVVESALNSYFSVVYENHGVKRQNLEKLLYPLGVLESKLNATWLANMSSFGANRGTWADKSIKAANAPDPQTEASKVDQLLQGLLQLDRVVSRLR